MGSQSVVYKLEKWFCLMESLSELIGLPSYKEKKKKSFIEASNHLFDGIQRKINKTQETCDNNW